MPVDGLADCLKMATFAFTVIVGARLVAEAASASACVAALAPISTALTCTAAASGAVVTSSAAAVVVVVVIAVVAAAVVVVVVGIAVVAAVVAPRKAKLRLQSVAALVGGGGCAGIDTTNLRLQVTHHPTNLRGGDAFDDIAQWPGGHHAGH